MKINENIAYRNIITRTSVRKYSHREVSDELKEALVRAGMSAPSGVNRQPWKFILIDDKELLRQLGNALPYAKMVTDAPIAIMVCGDRTRFLDGADATLWIQDVSAASENILLAANALGLGGVWTCLYPHEDRMENARNIMKINENLIPFSLIPIGYPLHPQNPVDKWKSENVIYNKGD